MRLMFNSFGVIVAACVAVASSSASAAIRDRQIDEARLCTQHFPSNERLNGIPTHLLAAIAASESGRWNDTLGMVIPWPWTINAEGKGYYFESKEEAIAKVRQLQARGMRSIDVGCMQVNLKHHPRAFANLEQAFDPRYNVGYAARFLRNNYNDLNSWTKATAAYHSRTPVYGNRYLSQIEKAWNTIVGKLRMARASTAQRGGDYATRLDEMEQERQFTALQREFDARERLPDSEMITGVSGNARNSPGRAQTAKKAQPRTSMKIIAVRDISAKDRTMIVRPQISGEETTVTPLAADSGEALQEVAMNSNDTLVMHFPANNSARRVTNGGSSANKASGAATKHSGPRFVFVD